MRRFAGAAMAATLLFTLSACGSERSLRAPRPTVEVADAAIRTVGDSALVTMTLTARGGNDSLVGIDAGALGPAMVHQSSIVDGVAQMRSVTSVPLDDGVPLRFEKTGYHAMIMPLSTLLKTGSTTPVTLSFDRAEPVTVEARVEDIADPMAAMESHDKMKD